MAKKSKINDPHAVREAQKYEHPIPSREYIQTYLREQGKPASLKQLMSALQLKEPHQQEALRRRLRAMERDGQLVRNRRGSYGLIDKMDLLRGRVIGHRDGFGFIKLDVGGDDLYLSPRAMRHAFDGDVVLARVIGIDKRGRKEAQIVEVLERNTERLVGRFVIEAGVGFVIADNKRITKDIIIPAEHQANAKPQQIVVVEIITQPSLRQRPSGKIIEILGDHLAPGMEISIALRSYDLPYQWPETVLNEIRSFTDVVNDNDKQGRADLRNLAFVTIDGEDARDFDDAVYCEAKPKGGWKLYVAIADVSHYVKVATALDEEAKNRGNSVYFPGEVIPMLPEILSNGLCSLNPQVDRLSMVCELNIDLNGKMQRYRFYPAVIRSQARLTYTQVAALLNNEKKLPQKYQAVEPHIVKLYELYKQLHQQRCQRGAIEFDTTETKFNFDKDRKIKAITPLIRNDAHRLIEECMLLANVAAAKFLRQHKIAGLYRDHEPPSETKVAELREFLQELGLRLMGGKQPKPTEFCKVITASHNRPDTHLIQTVLLRSLSQAVYSPDNVGHFGLAYSEYAHFTSPIRRYPDLLLHRAIKHVLDHQSVTEFYYDDEVMKQLGEHCSMTERRADEATRDVENWLKCEFMQHRLGEEFAGVITSVTGFGIFVELQNIYVEGLVHVTGLANDYYHFDPVRHRLVGERSGKRYRIGDLIRVRIVRVDLDERQMDFELVG